MKKKAILGMILFASAFALSSCSFGGIDNNIPTEETPTGSSDNKPDNPSSNNDNDNSSTGNNDNSSTGNNDNNTTGNTDNNTTGNTDNTDANSGDTGNTQTRKYIPTIKITHTADSTYPDENPFYFVTAPVSNVVKTEKASWSEIDTSVDPYYETCTISVFDDEKNLTVDEATAQVKVRGNWTTNYDKKSLRLKFNNKQSMLGLNDGGKYKNWVLLAGYKDWSLLRDSAGLYMADLISDNYVSDAMPVAVYINDTFWGIYTLAEQQQINEGRIDINKVDKNYTGTDIGYLLEYDGYARYEDDTQKFTIDTDALSNLFTDYYGDYAMYFNEVKTNTKGSKTLYAHSYSIKSDIYSINQTNYIKARLEDITTICLEAKKGNYYEFNSDYSGLQASTATTAEECIRKVIDVDSLVETYILQEIIVDPDLYYSSFYLSIDFSETGDKKLRFEAPWDFDSTMGNKYDTTTQYFSYSAQAKQEGIDFVNGIWDYGDHIVNANGMYAGMITTDVDGNYGCSNPWMIMFSKEAWFQDLVKTKWNTIKSDKVLEKTQNYINEMTALYGEDFESNFTKWTSTRNNSGVRNELNPRALACDTQAESAAYLVTWLGERFAILDTLFSSNNYGTNN